MIITEGLRYRAAHIIFMALALILADCSTTKQQNPRTDVKPTAIFIAKQDTALQLLDTILLRDVQLDESDSAYVVIDDTNTRVISLRAFVAGADFVLIDSYIPVGRNIDNHDRAYALSGISNAELFASRSTGSVDMEIVTANAISPLVELCINCTNGGPAIAGDELRTQHSPSICAGPWSIPVDSGGRLQTAVYPARPRIVHPIRTMSWGPAGDNTITQISWNCLRDDGTDAGKGRYMVQITTANTHGRRRVHCCHINVGDN